MKWEVSSEVGRGRPTYEEPPGGIPTIGVEAQEELCETNPIGPEPDTSQVQSGTAVMSDSAPKELRQTNPNWSAPHGTSLLRVNPDHGRDAHATELTRGSPAIRVQMRGQLCETNPIGPEPDTRQVLCGTAVMSDSASDGLRKTNPIGGTGIPSASLSGQALPVVRSHGQDAHATHGRDGRATYGRDTYPTAPPGGDGVNLPAGQVQLCETNPICALPRLEATEAAGSVPVRAYCRPLDRTEKTCFEEGG